MDLTPIRLWLDSLNHGTPWLVLVAVLGLVMRLIMSPQLAPYVVTVLGAKYQQIIGFALTVLGGLWPALTSSSNSPETDSAVGAFAGLIVTLIGFWRPPGPPSGGGPSKTLQSQPPSPGGDPLPPVVARAGAVSIFPPSVSLMMGVMLCVGCIGRTPAEVKARQSCLFAAELKADARSNTECFVEPWLSEAKTCAGAAANEDEKNACAAKIWDSCPSRESITEELKVAQEKCR